MHPSSQYRHPRWLGRLFVLVCLAILTVGCTAIGPLAAGAAAQMSMSAPAPSTDTPATPAAANPGLTLEEAGRNRILIVGADGNLFTVDPDGGRRLNLTSDASSTLLYNQPTWSSDGGRIAFTQLDGRRNSRLVTVAADGSDLRAVNVPFAPFFYLWNTQGDRLAYLSNWLDTQQTTLALRVTSFEDGDPALSTVALGQPLYFSWSPDGERLLTHIGNRETALTDLSGSRTVLAPQSGNFATPQWLNNGQLLYAVTENGRQQIVLADEAGQYSQRIAYSGIASFVLSGDGKRLAFVDTPQPMGTNAFGPLYLLDLEDQVYRQLSEDPVIYFAWSPGGDALHYFTVESGRGQIWLRSSVWTEEGITRLARFRPTGVFFEQYLRFADQYVQSHRYWSPDGSAIVYAGTGEDRRTGIWVQNVDGESDPVLIAEGVYAAWSPER